MSKTHCDDLIHDHKLPACLRYFLPVNRLPAMDKYVIVEAQGEPVCFATWKGTKRVRIVMASRMGDVGITTKLNAPSGCNVRVYIEDLSDFSTKP